MTRLWWRSAWLLLSLLSALVLLLAGVARAWEAPLPHLLYSADVQLYETRTGCASMLQPCSLDGEARLTHMGAWAGLWSPGGDYAAVYGYDGWLIFPADCFYERKECAPVPLNPPASGILIAWGPDGTTLAYTEVSAAGSVLHVLTRRCWDASAPGRCLRQRALLSSYYILNPIGWSADGDRLAFLSIQGHNLFTLESECLAQPERCQSQLEMALRAASAPAPPLWAHLSPDGEQVIFSADLSGFGVNEQLFRFDLASGTIERLTFHLTQSTQPQWSPDGRYLAYSGFPSPDSGDLSLFVADMQRGLHVRMITRHGQDVVGIRWGTP